MSFLFMWKIKLKLCSIGTLLKILLCSAVYPDFRTTGTTGLAAVGAVRGLADCSLRAGIDVKVLSISSNPLLKNIIPSITSMEPPDKETLIEQAFRTPRPLRIEYDAAELFIGESTELLPPGRRLP